MTQGPIQASYPDDFNHCYGCGQLNPHGHQIKTFWEGDKTVTRFTPQPYHTAIPGFVYGGLIASLIDCHGTGSAAAASLRAAEASGKAPSSHRFVTGSLNVTYLKPTPLGPELVLEGDIESLSDKKAVVKIKLMADGDCCATGKVIAIRIPENWGQNKS